MAAGAIADSPACWPRGEVGSVTGYDRYAIAWSWPLLLAEHRLKSR
jgi:hypothetical protein